MRTKLQLAMDACASELFVEAHLLLLDCMKSAAKTENAPVMAMALLAFADNVLEWCPADTDPFESRRLAAEDALKIFRQIGDQNGEARALLILASVDHTRTKDLDNAALALGRRLGEDALIAHAMSHLGIGASLEGQKEPARQAVRESLKHAEKSGDLELLADTLFTLGIVEDGAARTRAFERMASFQDRYGRKRRFARRLSAAASLISEDEPTRAVEWFNRSICIARGLADVQMEGSSLRGLADIERERGNQSKADELQALADVMCPLPDVTNVIKAVEEAVETHDVRSLDQTLCSILMKKPEPSASLPP